MKRLMPVFKRVAANSPGRALAMVTVATAVLLTLGYVLGFTVGAGQTDREAIAARQALQAEQDAALAEVQASRDRLQSTLQQLQSQLGEQSETAQASMASLSALQQNLSDLRQDYAALRERFDTQTASLRTAEDTAARLRTEMEQQRRDHDEAQRQQASDHATDMTQQQADHDRERARLRAALLQAGLDGALASTHGINWDRQLAAFEQQLTVEREALTTLQRQWQDFSSSLITELRDGSAIVALDDVALFESGASWPSQEGTERLRELATLLQALPDYRITVEGHTDARPLVQAATDDIRDNWALSAVRAASTVSTLVEFGVAPERLRAVGYASNLPVVDDPDAAPNRRVELVLYPPIEQRVLRLRQNQGIRSPMPIPVPQDATE